MATVPKAGMSSDKYTPGSVAKLLGTKSLVSGRETKLQAIFSKPAAQSRTQSVSTRGTQLTTLVFILCV